MNVHSEYLFGAPPPSAPPAPMPQQYAPFAPSAPQQYAPSAPFVSVPQYASPSPQYVMVPVPVPAASFPEPAPQMEQHQHHHYHPSKPPCKYGAKCYRKNPEHFKEHSHPPGVMERNLGRHSFNP